MTHSRNRVTSERETGKKPEKEQERGETKQKRSGKNLRITRTAMTW